MDAAYDRRGLRSGNDFESMVEAVRAGLIVAQDKKAYGKWKSARLQRGKPQRGLTGAALEQAVMRVAAIFPENVVTA